MLRFSLVVMGTASAVLAAGSASQASVHSELKSLFGDSPLLACVQNTEAQAVSQQSSAGVAASSASVESASLAYSVVAPGLSADFDKNGQVNPLDLAQWTQDFGVGPGSDANGDGRSSGLDFLIWQTQADYSARPEVSANPEPAALAVWGGLACIGGLIYRHRTSRASN